MKALAVAAMKCFEHYRPGGMRVWAGSIIMEPGLIEGDFEEIAAKGVWLAKAGFGAVKTPYDYGPMIAWAKKHGMVTMVHTGGSSIPGSSGIWADHLLAIKPDVSFHVNGGPVAMPDEDFPRIVNESEDRAAGLHRGQPAHDAAALRPRAEGRPVRPLPDRHRHADRQSASCRSA